MGSLAIRSAVAAMIASALAFQNASLPPCPPSCAETIVLASSCAMSSACAISSDQIRSTIRSSGDHWTDRDGSRRSMVSTR